MLTCTGCQNQNNKIATQEPADVFAIIKSRNSYIKKELDTNLNVDTKVIVPSNIHTLNTILVYPLKLDTSRARVLKTQLVANSNILHEDNSVIQTSDGKEILDGTNYFIYTTNKFKYIQPVFNYLPSQGNYNVDEFKQNQDLPFMPYQKAIGEVRKTIISLGISLDDTVEIYSLDYQTMQTQERILKKQSKLINPNTGSLATPKDHWGKDDDCYFMIFRTNLDGVPVYPKVHGYVEYNTFVPSDYIYACYSRNGLEYLSINSIYQKADILEKDVKIIGIEDALATIKRKYSNVILSSQYTITNMELYYMPQLINHSRDEFQMVPTWCMELVTTTENGSKNIEECIIDATNGGEIL